MATIPNNRASYQPLKAVDQGYHLSPTHRSLLNDVALQASLVGTSKTANVYRLRHQRLMALVRSLPKPL